MVWKFYHTQAKGYFMDSNPDLLGKRPGKHGSSLSLSPNAG
jgi:hypothetical protein